VLTPAAAEDGVIVTESASDFARVTVAPVLLVLTMWWPSASLTPLAWSAHVMLGQGECSPATGPTGWRPTCANPSRSLEQ
jgi:hypothetical protein